MRSGMLSAVWTAVVLAAVAAAAGETGQPGPWHISSVTKLNTARPGEAAHGASKESDHQKLPLEPLPNSHEAHYLRRTASGKQVLKATQTG